MPAVEIVRKMAHFGRSAARVAGGQIARSRVGSGLLKGLRAMAGPLASVMHQLWLEVTGFTFLVIAAAGAYAGYEEYGKYRAGTEPGPARVILAACFTLSFAWFGLSSFVRIRRKRPSQE